MSTQLAKYQGAVTLSQEQATEILTTVWPKAPEVEVWKAATICRQYGLNPLMKHLFLVCFNEGKANESWVPILGIKATRLMARRKIRFSYLEDTPRVMTKEEQERIFGIHEPEKLWVITKLRDGLGNEASGYGWYAKNASPYGSDKGNTAFNMASYRSERQAIDRLCPDTLPPDIDVMDEAFIETPSGLVDTETGELVEGQVVEQTIGDGEPPPPQGYATPDMISHMHKVRREGGWTPQEVMDWISESGWYKPEKWADLDIDQIQALIDHMRENPKADAAKAEADSKELF